MHLILSPRVVSDISYCVYLLYLEEAKSFFKQHKLGIVPILTFNIRTLEKCAKSLASFFSVHREERKCTKRPIIFKTFACEKCEKIEATFHKIHTF